MRDFVIQSSLIDNVNHDFAPKLASSNLPVPQSLNEVHPDVPDSVETHRLTTEIHDVWTVDTRAGFSLSLSLSPVLVR